MAQKYGLGRGLASLIPQSRSVQSTSISQPQKDSNYFGSKAVSDDEPIDVVAPEHQNNNQDIANNQEKNIVEEIDIAKIIPNPYQPRIHFHDEALQELADSIKAYGIIQPLVVSKKGGLYEIIAGERRYRAAQKAGLRIVPVIVREADDQQKLELAIIENVQRHDLDPIEEARSYERLSSEFNLTQEEIAQKTGKSRSVIANKTRLLKLPSIVQRALINGKISEGHAKTILAIEQEEKQVAFLEMILRQGLNVRQSEEKTKEVIVKSHARKSNSNPQIKAIEENLIRTLGTKVKLSGTEKSGKIIIDFYSQEELDSILEKIVK